MRQPVELIGTIRGTRSGFAFLAPEEGGEDLFVAAAGLNGAIHGDRVRAHLLYRDPYDFRPEVEIDEILERSRPVFSGDVGRAGRSWFVRPDSPLLPERLRLVLGSAPGVAGEKILFRVENRPDRERSLYAVFQEALGDEGDARLDPIIIATEHGLPLRFSDAAIVEAEARVAVTHDPQDARREDFREQFVLTIDPEDAKDFDDAVALERRSDGSFLLAVHIADVSFYIAEGRDLDKEAARRGTSVYFPGSVIPMLPDSVSSVAASLLPGVDRRVMTVLIDLAPDGRRRGARVTRGWIRSAARLDYGWAQAILDGKAEAEGTVTTTLRLMRDLARILRRRRFQRGGFELTVPEAEMRLGKDGVPVSIHRHEVLESHQLIEEFMIAANLATGAWALER